MASLLKDLASVEELYETESFSINVGKKFVEIVEYFNHVSYFTT